jgi:hypothetical protein
MNAAKLTGIAIATAAAGLFAFAAPAMAGAKTGHDVKCYGVNACKGKASCKTATNGCKGQNSCKGQGFVSMSKQACEQVGGEVKK